MIPIRDAAYLAELVHNLCNLPREPEWVEFKVNQATAPNEIGEYISALANGAALNGETAAYMLWGVTDDVHAVIGTQFKPSMTKQGGEPLENWLRRGLTPPMDFRFHEVVIDGKRVVVLEIEPTKQQPVAIWGKEYVRIGDVKTELRNHPEKERALWNLSERASFEDGVAAERLSGDDVILKLNYGAYFSLLQKPAPESLDSILYELEQDRLIAPCAAGGWNITNLGAILFSNRLGDFRRLERKSIRVIQYQGASRAESVGERQGSWGYAAGFTNLIKYINDRISNETIGQGLRRTSPMVPELAVRELVANALIHQDFSVTGAGPMVEIFDARVEITNPGAPLVNTQRFLGSPPRSRNETLASMMRRIGVCEERGSGIEKAVLAVESELLPAPLFEFGRGVHTGRAVRA